MSAVTTLNSGSYYQLSNPSAGPGGGVSSSPTDELLQALGGTSDDQSVTSPSDAYLLDLSPQATAMMNGTGDQSSALNPAESSSGSFVLTAQQQQTIANILKQYPQVTQANFDSIQNALQAAGLDPTTLSRLDEAQSFNPTELFVDDLNGDYSDADAMVNPDESAKSSNYMQQIISEWQQMSGNTGDASGSSSTPASTSATSAS